MNVVMSWNVLALWIVLPRFEEACAWGLGVPGCTNRAECPDSNQPGEGSTLRASSHALYKGRGVRHVVRSQPMRHRFHGRAVRPVLGALEHAQLLDDVV